MINQKIKQRSKVRGFCDKKFKTAHLKEPCVIIERLNAIID